MKFLSNLARLGGCTPGNPGMRRKINLEAEIFEKIEIRSKVFFKMQLMKKVDASETESPESFRSC